MEAYEAPSPRRRSAIPWIAGLICVLLGVDVVALTRVPVKPDKQAVRMRVLAASARTQGRHTARVAVTSTMRIELKDRPETKVTSTGDGVMDFASRAADIQLHQTTGITLEMRAIHGVSYIQFPQQLRSALKIATPWVAIDFSRLQPGETGGVNSSATGSIADTVALLEQESGGLISAATEAGHDRIRGVATTRYDLTVDIAALRQKITQLAANPLFAGLSVDAITIDAFQMRVWIDEQGLVRREEIDERSTVRQAVGAITSGMTNTTDYYDFGTAASVVAPPPSEVTTLSSFSQLVTH